MIAILSISNEIVIRWISRQLIVNGINYNKIGAVKGLMPPGNKPSPEPMFTKFYDTIWHP